MKILTVIVLLLTVFKGYSQLKYDAAGFETGTYSPWAEVNYNLNNPLSNQFQIVGLKSARSQSRVQILTAFILNLIF